MPLVRGGSIIIGVVVALVVAPLLSTVSASAFYHSVWRGSLGSPLGLGSVLTVACPLAIAGLGAAIAYRIGLWNLGLDGQILVGGWCAFGLGLLLPHLTGLVLFPLMVLAGMIGGGLWMLVPALARAFLGVSEIITTFLLSFVAMAWEAYWVTGPWFAPSSAGGGVESKPIPAQTQLGLLDIEGVSVHWGILIPVGLAVLLWLTWHFTRAGFQLRVMGASERTARYAGLAVHRRVVAVLLTSGAIGGLAGVVEMLGDLHYYGDGLTTNTGFEAVVIAVLAGGSELGVVVIALLYATLIVGGNAVSVDGVAPEVVLSLLGITLLCAAVGEACARLRLMPRSLAPASQDAEALAKKVVMT